MEFTTDLVLRSKFDSVTTIVVPRAHRPPTPLDWQRWAPIIVARYKSEPARVIIGEMQADGLLITEKIFRDRLRQWGLNIKNRRSAASPRRKALQSANNRDKGARPGSQDMATYHRSTRPSLLGHENVHNVLCTPKEVLVLQRTLKSVLDWQEHIEILQAPSKKVRKDECRLAMLLVTIMNALNLNHRVPWQCEKATRLLQSKSEALQNHIRVTCTPPAVFRSIKMLIRLASQGEYSAWHYQTIQFFVNTAAEILPSSHPSLLLIRLLFEEPTAAQLAMVYEQGFRTMQRCYGGAEADYFRAEFLTAVFGNGLGATFRSSAESLCRSSSDTNDGRSLLRIAQMCYSMDRDDECETFLRKCWTRLKAEGKGKSADSLAALHLLSILQNLREDYAGEVKSLRKYLAIELIRDRRSCHGPQLSMNALLVIADLDDLYRSLGLGEQRVALRSEFPDAFLD